MSVSSVLVERLCRIIVQEQLAPSAPLAAPAAAGATAISVDPVAARLFRFSGIVTFWDDTGELPVVLSDVNASTGVLTIDATATGRAALAFDHDAGAIIATNLILAPPVGETEQMLANGWPVLYVFSLDRDDQASGQEWDPFRILSLVIQLPGTQEYAGARIHPALFVGSQVSRADATLEVLATYLKNYPRMNLRDGTLGVALYVEFIRATLRDPITAGFGPVWEQYVDIGVHGEREEGVIF